MTLSKKISHFYSMTKSQYICHAWCSLTKDILSLGPFPHQHRRKVERCPRDPCWKEWKSWGWSWGSWGWSIVPSTSMEISRWSTVFLTKTLLNTICWLLFIHICYNGVQNIMDTCHKALSSQCVLTMQRWPMTMIAGGYECRHSFTHSKFSWNIALTDS